MKRKLLGYRLSVIVMLLFMGLYSYAQTSLIISKVTDPKDDYHGRFVQLYNAGSSDIDLAAGNWYLVKQVNGSSMYDIELTGTIAAGSTYVIAGYSDFNTLYGFDPDMTSSQISGNGDDGYFLYQGGGHASGTMVDAYGVKDEDGTGKAWEYTDGKAVRNRDVNVPNTTWTASEWTITRPANVADMDPVHFTHGADVTPPTWTTGFPQTTCMEDTRGTVLVNLDEPGKVYFIVVPAGADAPTAAQVKAGDDYGSVTLLDKDSVEVTKANTTVAYNLTGAQPSSSADIWFVAEDNSGNLQADPVKVSVQTTAARSLTITAPAAGSSYNIGETATLEWTSANIDSLMVGVYYLNQGIDHLFPISDGKIAAAEGSYDLVIPQEAEPGDVGIVLWDACDTSFKQILKPITIVDNRSLQLTAPKDGDTAYVGDTLVFRWTSANIDSVLIGGYIGGGQGPDGGYFMLTGDMDHPEDTSRYKPVAAAAGVWKMYLDPNDVGGSIKIDSIIIWNAGDMRMKDYASPVYVLDTFPMRISSSMPTFGMTDFMPGSGIWADFNCDSIIRGTGNLYLKKADGTVVKTIKASDVEIHGSSIWFMPDKPLMPGASYYIEIDPGFVKCADGSKTYPGLSGKEWSFTMASSTLYFSEYIEGSSNNKALEIYNPTGQDVNLDDYFIASSYNGSGIDDDKPVYHFPKGYVLKAGDVFVVANSQASSDILAHANDTVAYNEGNYVCGFNGDDARVLMKEVPDSHDRMWVDAIGNPWEDPGAGWDVAGVTAATKDHTLLRKRSVKMGNGGNWGMSAGWDADNSEWIVKDQNFFGNIGLPTPLPQKGMAITFNVDMHYAKNFDPSKDSVIIAGNFPGATWNEPGTNPKLRMSDADSNMIYTLTLNIDTSAYDLEYKYFVNAGWGGGEWDGGDNRKVHLSGDTTLNDIFGYADNKLPALDLPFSEDFTGVTSNDPLTLTGWLNVNVADGADRLWIGKVYKDNGYAQFSSYKSTSPHGDTAWLITPALNMDNTTDEMLSFDINVAYWTHAGLHVLVSTDFDQTKEGIAKAHWTDITSDFNIPTEPTSGYGTFGPAGRADLSAYNGILNVAFVYMGDAASGKTTTYQIDNVKVESTTGIQNVGLSDKVELYPNPGDGHFHIALHNALKGAVSMRIVDITGRVVMQQQYEHVPATVDVNISAQPSNMYFITLTDGHNTIVKKFMKR
jgi:hypothetical protein